MLNSWKKPLAPLLLSLGVAVTLFGSPLPAASAQSLKSSDGFTITPTVGWIAITPTTVKTAHGVEHEYRYVDPNHVAAMGVVAFYSKSLPPALSDDGLVVLRDVSKSLIASRFPGYQLVDQKVYLVNGLKTIGLRGDYPARGQRMALDMLCTIHAGVGYLFILATPTEERAVTEAAYSKFVTSVRWTQPKP